MPLLQNIHKYDIRSFNWCLRIKQRGTAIRISRIISFSADGPLYILIGLCFLYFQQWDMAKLLAAAFIIERGAYLVFKTTFRRNRPPEAIPGYESEIKASDQFSFPSGHTSAAFLMAGVLSFIFPSIGWALYLWACGVGMSRIMLGVHFPSDILAGALLGSGICALLITLLF